MRAIIVGTGVGGATMARELARNGFEVVVLEAGGRFRPATRKVTMTEPLRRLGLMPNEKNASRFLPAYQMDWSSDDLLLVRGISEGGCSVLSCGNLVRAENGLKELGLDLTVEFEALEREIGTSTIPKERWRPASRHMFDMAVEMGMSPVPTPKAVNTERCVGCGLCELGCPTGARWDSRKFLREAVNEGAKLLTDTKVERVLFKDGKAVGVMAGTEGGIRSFNADLVVLSAGGIGTAQVLRRSGVSPSDTLWADIVLTVGGSLKGARMLEEPPMVWVSRRDGYIVSPYLDVLSHWFHRPWRKVGLKDRVGVMIKMAESPNGRVNEDGTVTKPIDTVDSIRLQRAAEEVRELMSRSGIGTPFVDGMLNGGHLGGTVPLRRTDIGSMHPSILPDGLWVADLSLLPNSQGLPTMLTTSALALRVSKAIIEGNTRP